MINLKETSTNINLNKSPQIYINNGYSNDIFIHEFKIIKDINLKIKNDISTHLNNCLYIDDLFNILDFQLLFINQISKILRNNEGNEDYKNKIVHDLIQINKEMIQVMIISFISKINNKINNNSTVRHSSSVTKTQGKFLFKLDNSKKKNTIENNKKIIKVKDFIENNNSKNNITNNNNYNNNILIKSKKKNKLNKVKYNENKTISNSLEKKFKLKFNDSLIEEKKKNNPVSLTKREIKPYNQKEIGNRNEKLKKKIMMSVSTDTLQGKTINKTQIFENHLNLSENNLLIPIENHQNGELINQSFQKNYNKKHLYTNFEEKLIEKYQTILNKYNNQKSEKQKIKEAEKAYYESINRDNQKFE